MYGLLKSNIYLEVRALCLDLCLNSSIYAKSMLYAQLQLHFQTNKMKME